MKKQRIDAGTDAALLGAWDLSRDDVLFSKEEVKYLHKSLASDSGKGHLFFIQTGADCGGPIDVYVDREAPEIVTSRTNKIEQNFLLSLPSGKLVVGGVEDYRRKGKKITAAKSVVNVPAGDYSLTCYVAKDEEERPEDRSEKELARLVGAENVRYFDRITNWGCMVGVLLPLLLFFFLSIWMGLIALPVTIVVSILYFYLLQGVLKRNERYRRLEEIIPAFRLKHERPLFVFVLKKIEDKGGLKGGFIDVSQGTGSP